MLQWQMLTIVSAEDDNFPDVIICHTPWLLPPVRRDKRRYIRSQCLGQETTEPSLIVIYTRN